MEIGITERGDAAIDLNWINFIDSMPMILITKNPLLLSTYLRELPKFNVIVHCTITGYGGSIIESNVPIPEISFKGFKEISSIIGVERTVLRIDPIIPTKKGVEIAKEIYKNKVGHRVRISFLDLYNHIKERFPEMSNELNKIYKNKIHAPLSLRNEISKLFPEAEICGEPGMKCTGCISEKDIKIFNIKEIKGKSSQRSYCNCLANKKELLLNKYRCSHGCVYCYWKDLKKNK